MSWLDWLGLAVIVAVVAYFIWMLCDDDYPKHFDD
jgi:hypothetical protein